MFITRKLATYCCLLTSIVFYFGCGSNSSEGTGSKIAIADTTAKSPEKLFTTCTACHGHNGEGIQAMNAPALAGQEEDYLIRQLKNLKNGIRGTHEKDTYGKQMVTIAANLKDGEIEPIARYIKALSPVKITKTITGNLEAGKTKYNAVCASCHGPDATGNKTLFAPKLVGVGDWYLKRQIQNFINGIRGAHPQDVQGIQMAAMAKTIGDEQAITDVVAYIQTLDKSK